jgi:hypothetical protein
LGLKLHLRYGCRCKKVFRQWHRTIVRGNTPCRRKEYYHTQLCCDIARWLA